MHSVDMSIFKAYDIRGIYLAELNESKAEAIGWAIAEFIQNLHPGHAVDKSIKLVVGRDTRLSSESLLRYLLKGIVRAGAEMVDIGLVTTPMSYFANGAYGFDGSIMVTASHNPARYNGFKVCREKAIALSETTGLKEIERLSRKYRPLPGNVFEQLIQKRPCWDIKEDYKKHILEFLRLTRPLKVVVDTANGVVGPIFDYVFKETTLQIIPLYFEPDGAFPNHEPNPLKDENLTMLKSTVIKNQADLGVAFDGDGDRCIFVDEKGERVASDLITALIAREMLSYEKGAGIVYDLRSSRVVKEEIEKAGGQPIRERVGHAFIKDTMRCHNAVFGGELSGHYYFRAHYFADSGLVAFVYLINALSKIHQPISALLEPLRRSFASGEINFEVADKDAKLAEISRVFQDGKQDFLDGITVEYQDWWFNVRKSNTEPLLRLNLEARTEELLEAGRKRVLKVIKSDSPR